MHMNKNTTSGGPVLSSNMEDYLEAITILSNVKKFVRVKDIAEHLKIKMPSVTSALKKLSEMGYIFYEKYSYVELTDEGKSIADSIYGKHKFLKDFFSKVLGLNMTDSDSEACRIEHHLSPEGSRKLNRLLEFYLAEEKSDKKWVQDLKKILSECALSEVKEGDVVEIVKLSTSPELKKRLIDLGFHRGERVTVVRYAPLKDPMQLKIKDSNISIRITEAESVIVRKLKSKK